MRVHESGNIPHIFRLRQRHVAIRALRRFRRIIERPRTLSRNAAGLPIRSEEHTSELQSHSDLVCRLLLEKKKNERDPPPSQAQEYCLNTLVQQCHAAIPPTTD